MTTRDTTGTADGAGKVAPESLELRARPQPVTRINRKVLIGGAAVVLVFILMSFGSVPFMKRSHSHVLSEITENDTDWYALFCGNHV